MNNSEKINIINNKIDELQESLASLQSQLNGASDLAPFEEDIPYMEPYIEDLSRQISALQNLKQVLST